MGVVHVSDFYDCNSLLFVHSLPTQILCHLPKLIYIYKKKYKEFFSLGNYVNI